jgi:branched-chain amino acid transport system ATP-binding protein
VALLETVGLTRSFGSLVAVEGVDFALAPGEVRAVIGPNGAGKTVFMHLLSGLLAPSRGRIRLDGEDITRLDVVDRVRRGVTRSFQVTNVFPNLTVAENVRLAIHRRGPRRPPPSLPQDRIAPAKPALEQSSTNTLDRVREVLELVGLADAAALYPPELAHGDQRHLEIALALAPGPRLLLLDEPTAGMSLGETTRTASLIKAINREAGVTIVIVEHDMRVVAAVADRITVLDRGRVLAEGTPAEIAADPRVREAYLGRGRRAAGL